MEYYDLYMDASKLVGQLEDERAFYIERIKELEAENAQLRADLERLIDAIMGESEE